VFNAEIHAIILLRARTATQSTEQVLTKAMAMAAGLPPNVCPVSNAFWIAADGCELPFEVDCFRVCLIAIV
jgi:hypothetical protein